MLHDHARLGELLRRKQLLIFDLDGTLVDSSTLHERAFNQALTRFRVTVDYPAIAGLTTERAVDRIATDHALALDADERRILIDEKRNLARTLIGAELVEIDGAAAFVAAASRRFRLALFTSGSRATADVSLARIGLTGVFDPIVAAEDVRNGKPDPEGLHKVLAHHRLQPDDALVFEDAPSGLAAAVAAGIGTIEIGPETGWAQLSAALHGIGA